MRKQVSSALKLRTEWAKELLGAVRHAAMATVNEDGSPHNTPVLFSIARAEVKMTREDLL